MYIYVCMYVLYTHSMYTYIHLHIGTSLVLRWLRFHVSTTVSICWWKEDRNAIQPPWREMVLDRASHPATGHEPISLLSHQPPFHHLSLWVAPPQSLSDKQTRLQHFSHQQIGKSQKPVFIITRYPDFFFNTMIIVPLGKL